MKKLTLATLTAASLLVAGGANANLTYLNLGDNSYDGAPYINDANFTTAAFDTFNFNGLLATSVYDVTDGSLFGDFFDTNISSELTPLGIPAAGIAMDGITPVSIVDPGCDPSMSNGSCDINELNPLAPPFAGQDGEGFLLTWDFQVQYKLEGTLTAAGPQYTGGYLDVYFNDFLDDSNDRKVFRAEVTGSTIQLADLEVRFDITMAEAGFLFIDNGSDFVDAADGIVDDMFAQLVLNTNVTPPVPGLDELLLVNGGASAVRQSDLNGQLTASIPEPASLAILGLGMLGLGAVSRRRK